MNLDFISEVWDALRSHVDSNERASAAESLVSLLIDHNYEVDDIKESFRDKDVVKALKFYTEHEDEDEFHDEDDEYDE